MSDRTEALLAELVELQRRTVTNQERALSVQDHSIALQTEGIVRYKRTVRIVWFLIAAIVLLMLASPMLPTLLNVR